MMIVKLLHPVQIALRDACAVRILILAVPRTVIAQPLNKGLYAAAHGTVLLAQDPQLQEQTQGRDSVVLGLSQLFGRYLPKPLQVSETC